MQLLAKFKKILYMRFRATLNFRKFKVALESFHQLTSFPGSLILLPQGGGRMRDPGNEVVVLQQLKF